MNPVIYIFMNKSLNMSAGKLAAQAAHAAMRVGLRTDNGNWIEHPHQTILVMEARDESHLRSISEYLAERNIMTYRVIDEGVNEIDPHVWTALATSVLDKDDENTQKALSTFSLYRDKVRVTLDIDR